MTDAADWRGRVGQEWARRTEALERLLGPVGAAGLDALGPVGGARVLDLGCGAGSTAHDLAGRGAAAVTGIDISPDLLAVARARPADPRVTFVEADAATATFAQPFDALYSRCGAMFFDDPVAALAHLRTQMRAGARGVVVCWRAPALNPWAMLPLEASAPVFAPAGAPIGPGPGPFAWAEPEVFAPILRQAGWRDVAWSAVTRPAIMEEGDDPDPARRATAFAMRIGPLSSRLRDTAPELRSAVAAALETTFRGHVAGGHVRLSGSAWIVTMRA